jgi:thymidylate synthase
MVEPILSGMTLDDVMRFVIQEILAHGDPIKPTKGAALELGGVLLELTNPRARLSRTAIRGKPYSCLGEFCWYLAKTNDLAFISYYLPEYKKYAGPDQR